ncbi:hypothetical protein EVAR_48603_1 [Eumeta japonica]|uniref:Uncharacterized protein n=1 Tax=Eumeta variegata TaxID=151549 RepID=A0A4C1Z0V8_EUMVA|nr:hypothetical protein EVAR_48603_1 [Eumeta japonica]
MVNLAEARNAHLRARSTQYHTFTEYRRDVTVCSFPFRLVREISGGPHSLHHAITSFHQQPAALADSYLNQISYSYKWVGICPNRLCLMSHPRWPRASRGLRHQRIDTVLRWRLNSELRREQFNLTQELVYRNHERRDYVDNEFILTPEASGVGIYVVLFESLSQRAASNFDTLALTASSSSLFCRRSLYGLVCYGNASAEIDRELLLQIRSCVNGKAISSKNKRGIKNKRKKSDSLRQFRGAARLQTIFLSVRNHRSRTFRALKRRAPTEGADGNKLCPMAAATETAAERRRAGSAREHRPRDYPVKVTASVASRAYPPNRSSRHNSPKPSPSRGTLTGPVLQPRIKNLQIRFTDERKAD